MRQLACRSTGLRISTTYVITDATVVIDKTPWLIFGGTDRETLVFVGAKTWSVKRNFWERFWGVDSWKLTIGTLAQEDDPINAQLFHLPGGERLGSILQLLIVPRRE